MPISLATKITTPRCELRYPHKDDIPVIWSATRFAGFNDGMLWDPPENIEELEAAFERTKNTWLSGDVYTFSIYNQSSTDLIGRISIRKVGQLNDKRNEWSIGFWIHPDSQSMGYASESAQAIVEFGFRDLGARLITAAHATWNTASGRVLAKIGMQRVGLNPQGFQKNGQWVEEYDYEIRLQPE